MPAEEVYLNLEYDLGIEKLGPLTTTNSSEEDVKKVSSAIIEKIKDISQQ